MAKQKIFSEKEVALQEMIDARVELQRAEQLFNYANEQYFEIANMELSIAEMKYKVAMKKLKMLCQDENVPQINLFFGRSL